MLHQFLGALAKGGFVGGVEAVAQERLGNGEGVAVVVEHQDFSGVLAVPQKIPAACVGLVHILAVVDDAHGAPGVGHGVAIFRVIGGVAEGLIHVLVVGNVVEIERLKHVLFNEAADHIVRGDDDVVAGAAGFELGVEALVAVVGEVVHMNAGGLLEGRDHIQGAVGAVGDILSPVVDGDFVFRRPGRHHRQKRQDQEQGKEPSHIRTPRFLAFRPASLAWRRFMVTMSTRITRNIMVKRA